MEFKIVPFARRVHPTESRKAVPVFAAGIRALRSRELRWQQQVLRAFALEVDLAIAIALIPFSKQLPPFKGSSFTSRSSGEQDSGLESEFD